MKYVSSKIKAAVASSLICIFSMALCGCESMNNSSLMNDREGLAEASTEVGASTLDSRKDSSKVWIEKTTSNGKKKLKLDLSNDSNNCGEVGNTCSFAHSAPTCEDSVCVLGACDDEWQDFDRKLNTGCEQYFPNLKQNHVIISEVMPVTASEDGTAGQFIELYNRTNNTLNLKGLEIKTENKNQSFTLDTDLIVAPNSYVLFADPNTPDNFSEVDVQLGVTLGKTDMISILYKSVEINSVSYDTDWYVAGVSMQLDKANFFTGMNDDRADWCDSTMQYLSGEYGTPRRDNSICN